MILRRFFTAITRLSIRFQWITIAFTIAFLVLGVYAAAQLNQELLPNIEFPQTFIITVRPGASSEDLRDLVTIPLEDEIVKIPHIFAAGLESTTVSPIAFITAQNEYTPNQNAVREGIQAAIDKVVADGVPLGLKTTDDLTLEIMTKVVGRAPSMFKHFESAHLLAMNPAVRQAGLDLYLKAGGVVDFVTLDALAVEAISGNVLGKTTTRAAVELPDAWRLGEKDAQGNLVGVPRLLTFNLSALPVVTASVSSSTLSTEDLRTFVNEQLVPELKAKDGVANIGVSGGESIPDEVIAAAMKAIAAERAAGETPGKTTPPTPVPSGSEGGTTSGGTDPARTAPELPMNWRRVGIGPLSLINPLPVQLKDKFATVAKFDDANDLLSATNEKGETLSAATLLNQIAELNPNSPELLSLPVEVSTYVRAAQPDFTKSLSPEALKLVGSSILSQGAWTPLLGQEAIRALNIKTFSDFTTAEGIGGVASFLNKTYEGLGASESWRPFLTRLGDSLLPESIAYIETLEPTFLKTLNPAWWAFFSRPTLLATAANYPTDQADALTKIAKGETPTAAEALAASQAGNTPVIADDPNAPDMPESWVIALTSFGFKIKSANDLFKPPFGNPGAFFNQAAASPGAASLMKDLPADLLLYLNNRDPKFFETLGTSTLALLAPEVIEQLPAAVRARVNGGPVYTATNNVTRANGNTSLIISVSKETEANTVRVFHAADEVFKKLMAANPEIKITPTFEQASFIEESISGVAREGGLGGIMAVIVILIFLNFSVRSTIVTAVSIPTSLAIAFILMRYLPGSAHNLLTQSTLPEGIRTFLLRLFPNGITLNIMTLSGLTVAIGRVVDDSIVVLENIYRQLQKGMDRKEAVIKGTRDVSVAIFAATLTTIVVFLPIGLTGGIVGEFFLPFGLAVTYSLAASFIVAITLIPVLAYLFIPPNKLPEEKEGRLESLYHGVLEWALNKRALVLAVAAVTFVVGMAIFASRPQTFLPSFGEPQISITIAMPPGTQIAETDALTREMEAFIAEKINSGGGITRYQTTIGSGGGFGDIAALLGGASSVNGSAGQMVLAIEAKGEELDLLTREVREKAAAIFGEKNVTVSRASISEQGFGGFNVVASGPEADLKAVNETIKATLAAVPGLANVSSTLDLVGDATSYLRIERKAAAKYTAELEVTDTLGVTALAIKAAKDIPNLPETITVDQGFQSRQQTEGFVQTFSAMGVAIAAVYIVMVLTFGSLIHPFTILFTLPLAVVGAAVGLWVTNRVVGISALIGLLMLIGIVVTNAIVMIDRVQQNRKEKHLPLREALIEGARTRLRPILMTAIATMFALLPLAIGLSEGAIIAAELGTVVIGGLFSSTLLTLVVIPVLYSLFSGFQQRLLGGGKEKPAPAPAGD
ncbi:MAG TPA: efflux RND transporter permease subunit [Aggregatilineales bacterium]|nr:efflux RND transporter permease subunit [Anaerolineales bacterium]HRE46169.1 efflux RND transporter permease subunit [Aggregatilineales bacterium]